MSDVPGIFLSYSGTTTIRDSALTSNSNAALSGSGTLVARLSVSSTDGGIRLLGGTATIEDTTIALTGESGRGLLAEDLFSNASAGTQATCQTQGPRHCDGHGPRAQAGYQGPNHHPQDGQ